eukprot:6194848-Pleurochrysis_carterae.AAC.1
MPLGHSIWCHKTLHSGAYALGGYAALRPAEQKIFEPRPSDERARRVAREDRGRRDENRGYSNGRKSIGVEPGSLQVIHGGRLQTSTLVASGKDMSE